MSSIISRILEAVISDNGPQYSSEQFAEFTNKYGFSHITSSPKYPQSNGAAERAVRTIKDLLKKNRMQDEDMYMAMLAYKSTALDNGLSPAELLMGRKLRTTVPILPQELTPKLTNHRQLCMKESQQKDKQRKNFNKRHRAAISKLLKKGDRVWLSEMGKKATVVKQKGIRSYLVRMEDGSIYRRNRKHLNWLPKNVDEEMTPAQLPKLISILPPPISSSDARPMTYQTRSGRTVRAPLRYRDSGST